MHNKLNKTKNQRHFLELKHKKPMLLPLSYSTRKGFSTNEATVVLGVTNNYAKCIGYRIVGLTLLAAYVAVTGAKLQRRKKLRYIVCF